MINPFLIKPQWLFLLKGQSRENVGELTLWGDRLGPTKNSYGFLNFSNRPFNSCDFSKFTFCFNKTRSHIEWYCSLQYANLFMLISWNWTNSKGLPTTNENSPVYDDWSAGFQCFVLQSFHPRQTTVQSQQSVSVQDSNRVGAQDVSYAWMSVCINSTRYRISYWHPARSKIHPASSGSLSKI
jgi:hypothetical protein